MHLTISRSKHAKFISQDCLMRRDDPNKILFAAVTKGMGKGKILGALGVQRIKEICAELDQGGDFKCEKIFGTGATGIVCLPAACICQQMPGCMQCPTRYCFALVLAMH
jgi:hypothetical protein